MVFGRRVGFIDHTSPGNYFFTGNLLGYVNVGEKLTVFGILDDMGTSQEAFDYFSW